MADRDRFVNIADLKAKLRYWCKSRGASKQTKESLMETIKRIPYTVQADISETLEVRNGWIPCSERLPEKQGKCLVTTESGQVEIRTFLFSLTQGASPYFSGCEKVIAWMPAPDAYEPPKRGAESG